MVSHCPKITWTNPKPVWVEQWPLPRDKLTALKEIVQDLLGRDCIEPSFSPYNSPVFVIKKKSGKWRMLIDLRAVNSCMLSMGALQPGLPTPTAIPKGWAMIVIDIKDCFYSIPLHPHDKEKFAFSVPSVNYQAPYSRYQFKVLPQGMTNSPTLCQFYVASLLEPVRGQFSKIMILHYMDDILIAAPEIEEAKLCLKEMTTILEIQGLQIAPEKIQMSCPVDGPNVFTDATKSAKAVVYEPTRCFLQVFDTPYGSTQKNELFAILKALELF